MKISEIKGEDAIEVLGLAIEPMGEIFKDEEFKKLYNEGTNAQALSYVLLHHKKEAIAMLAALELETPEEYLKHVGVLTIPLKLLEIINDKDLRNLFQSQGQEPENASFGSATENTKAEEK